MRAACRSRSWSTKPYLGRRRTPEIPWEDTIIYEAHVKGLTQTARGRAAELRGTYRGLPARDDRASQTLGVTAIELLPIHAFVDDRLLEQRAEQLLGL